MRRFLAALAMGGVFGLGGVGHAAPGVGAPSPAFVGKAMDGATLDLSALRGHIVVVNLWATWCTPCRAEMPMLEGFYRKHQADGVVLVGLSADRRRDEGEVRRVMRAFTYPAALLAEGTSNGFGSPTALPVTYVLRKDGIIGAVFSGADGPLTEPALGAAVARLSAQP